MTAGRFFARDGFFRLAFTPVLDVGPLTSDSLRYTHYPPLPDIVNGLIQKLIREPDIAVFRLVAIGLSALGTLAFYRWISNVWGNRVATFATLFTTANFLVLQYADCIHHVPLYTSLGYCSLWALSIHCRHRKTAPLLVATVCFVLCWLASYDFIVFLPCCCVLTVANTFGMRGTFSMRDKRGIRALICLAAAGVGAILLKNGLVAWAVGLSKVISDLRFQFFERATGIYTVDYRDAIVPTLTGRVWRFFGPTFLVGTVFCAFDRRLQPDANPGIGTSRLALALGAAGLPFLLIFSELFCGQYHSTLLLVPVYSVCLACFVAANFEASRFRRVGAWFAVALSLTWFAKELVRFEKTFTPREDIVAVKQILEREDDHRVVLSNTVADGQVRYYWNRHILPVPTEREVVELERTLDTYGDNTPVFVIVFRDIEHMVFDKHLYGYFSGERRWGWITDPFGYRAYWRPQLRGLEYWLEQRYGKFGTIAYESKALRLYRISRETLLRAARSELPQEQTTNIDFEARFAERFKLKGFGGAEQHFSDRGFSALLPTQPAQAQYTLQGLKNVPHGKPQNEGRLQVRMAPGSDYTVRILAYSKNQSQTLSLAANNASHADAIAAWCPDGPRELVFRVASADLNADGVQILNFIFSDADALGQGMMFHSMRIDPVGVGRPLQ
jgi:hypothetical protein